MPQGSFPFLRHISAQKSSFSGRPWSYYWKLQCHDPVPRFICVHKTFHCLTYDIVYILLTHFPVSLARLSALRGQGLCLPCLLYPPHLGQCWPQCGMSPTARGQIRTPLPPQDWPDPFPQGFPTAAAHPLPGSQRHRSFHEPPPGSGWFPPSTSLTHCFLVMVPVSLFMVETSS